jgi:type IV pilus assembly protein PilV
MPYVNRRRGPLRQQGASLIEVLVAVLILALGVLAMAGVLAISNRFGKTSEMRSASTLLAADMADRMRANLAGLSSYALMPTALNASAGSASTCTTPGACTAAEMAAVDLAEWNATLYNTLPSGTGFVRVSDATNRMVDLWVIWVEPTALDTGFAANSRTNDTAQSDGCPPNFSAVNAPRCMYFRIGL